MATIKNIAGVIVLYNPRTDLTIQNIKSYIESIDRLYVVDNSESKLDHTLSKYLVSEPRIEYIPFFENRGIAFALNKGAGCALKAGYEWLLTMDQDSKAPSGMVEQLYEFAQSGLVDHLAIVAAATSSIKRETQQRETPDWELVVSVFTSGNLLRLSAWEKVGGWRNELFIDYVDHLFNLDLALKNYKIVQRNDVLLDHSLGDTKKISIFGRYICNITQHSYVRRYYISRNRSLMFKLYSKTHPEWVSWDRGNQTRVILKLILFEKDKIRKLRSVVKGWVDCRNNKFGKMS